MNTKKRYGPLLLLGLAAIVAATTTGCGAGKTPLGMCYTATGAFSIAQDAIGEAVTMPELEGTKAKTTLKQISQKGTDAVHACRDAAVASNADGVAFALGALNGAAQIGGQIATEIITANISRASSRPASLDTGPGDPHDGMQLLDVDDGPNLIEHVNRPVNSPAVLGVQSQAEPSDQSDPDDGADEKGKGRKVAAAVLVKAPPARDAP